MISQRCPSREVVLVCVVEHQNKRDLMLQFLYANKVLIQETKPHIRHCGCWLLSNNLTGNTYQLNNLKKDSLKAHIIKNIMRLFCVYYSKHIPT